MISFLNETTALEETTTPSIVLTVNFNNSDTLFGPTYEINILLTNMSYCKLKIGFREFHKQNVKNCHDNFSKFTRLAKTFMKPKIDKLVEQLTYL